MGKQNIFQLDFAYLETFSKRIDTTWGSLFCNEHQPSYYDANHAHVSDACENPQAIIDEVVDFYESRQLIPRFYLYNLDSLQNLIAALKENQFGYEELISPVQLWDKKTIEIEPNENVTIENVTEENYEDTLLIECSVKEFGGKEVREKAFVEEFNHPSFVHYLLRYEGVACATACLFINEKQARLESVATLEEYRGRGLIGELIRYIQKEAVKQEVDNLWVFPIDEKIENVYRKYGFQSVEKRTTGHAFLRGKSITEIRG